VTATFQGQPVENCLDNPACPEVVVMGETATFTFTANSPDVVAFEYFDNSNGHPPVEGSTVSVDVPVGTGSLLRVDVQAINAIGQRSTTTHFVAGTTRPPGPIGSWSFDDGSGTTAADGPGLTHPLALSGAAFEANGRLKGALTLDGSNDFAAANESVVDTSRSFSISTWARPTSASKLGVVAAVNGTNSAAAGLGYDPATTRWVFARSSADVSKPTVYKASSKEAPVNGAWSHLLATYDATSGALKLFVNGRLQQETSSPIANAWKATGALSVGRGLLGAAAGGYFADSIDNLQIWQRVLLPEEVLQLQDPRESGSANTPVITGNAAYWPLDTATRGTDQAWRSPEAIRGADLTVSGFRGTDQSKAFVEDADRGKVLDLTGSTKEALTLNRAVVDASASFAVAVMVKVTDPSKPGVLIRQGTSTKDTWRIAYEPIDATTGRFTFARANADATTETVIATRDTDISELQAWHLIVGQYRLDDRDPSHDEISLSVDLRTQDTATFTAPRRDGTTTLAHSNPAFAGRIDDARIYTGVLSPITACADYPGQRNCGL
jgi:hypothetical protein